MPDAIELRTKQYNKTLELVAQQTRSKLIDKVMTGSHTGTSVSVVDELESFEMDPVTAVGAPIIHSAQEYTRRWVRPISFYKAFLRDTFVQLESEIDPQSKLMAGSIAAINRAQDDRILAAFFGDALTGPDGATTTTWASEGSSSVVPVNEGGGGSNVGLNVAKLKAALEIIMGNDVDIEEEQIYIGYNAKAHGDLLAEAQIISLDYNEKPVLKDGRIMSFLGMNFVHTQRVITDSNGYYRLPVWTKKAMHFGTWKAPRGDISQRKDIQGLPWQVYLDGSFNATRVDAKRLVELKITAS